MIALAAAIEGNAVRDLSKTVSASRLNCFHRCRLQFYFRYVLEVKKQKSPALHLGSCVHLVLKAWNKSRWKNHQLTTDELHQVYLTAWADQESPVKWDDDEDEQREDGWKLLEQYFSESYIKPDEKPDAVEVAVEADLEQHGLPTLVGIIDLVHQQKIIDYKTSAAKPNASVAHIHEIQTSSYAVLYRAATGQKEKGIELHSLVKTKTPKIFITSLNPMTQQQQTKLFKCIESYVNGYEAKDFVPSPGIQCCACEYINECRVWC